jgi:hypothetical protein
MRGTRAHGALDALKMLGVSARKIVITKKSVARAPVLQKASAKSSTKNFALKLRNASEKN